MDLVAWIDVLLDADDALTVEAHVQGCRRCAELVAEASTPLYGEPDLEPVPRDTGFRLTGDVVAQPEPGEVWALEWDDFAFLAVVTAGADTAAVNVVPVTAEAPTHTEVPHPVVAGFHPAPTDPVTVPLGVFRERVAHSGMVAWPSTDSEPNSAPTWTRALLWATSLAALERSRHASWAPSAEPGESLADMVRARGLRPRELSERTGLEPGALTELLRSDRAPSSEEADLLAGILGVDPVELMTVEIPEALVWAVERPTNRDRIRRRADAAGRSEAEQRRVEAEAVLAVPARTTTRERNVDTWDELLGHHLGD